VANLLAIFEVSSFNRSGDMEGSHNCKSKSRDPITTPFDLILHYFFFVRTPVANLCAKFEVSSFNRSRDMVKSQNFKSRSRDPGHSPPLSPNSKFL